MRATTGTALVCSSRSRRSLGETRLIVIRNCSPYPSQTDPPKEACGNRDSEMLRNRRAPFHGVRAVVERRPLRRTTMSTAPAPRWLKVEDLG